MWTSPSPSRYLDIAGLKINEDNHFCIVTLEKTVQFSDKVAPLCLPDINNPRNQYDDGGELRAQILGFGYYKNHRDTLIALAEEQNPKTNERWIKEDTYTFLNSTLCMQKFDEKWALSRHTTEYSHASFLEQTTYKDTTYVDIWDFGYFWIEK